jgi:hypothetical protein
LAFFVFRAEFFRSVLSSTFIARPMALVLGPTKMFAAYVWVMATLFRNRLATPRVLSRNDLLAERERLAREERQASQRLDALRGQLDELSNKLGVAQRESERDPALWMTNQARAHQGLPPLKELPPGPPQPKRGGPIDAAGTAKAIIAAGRRARGEPDDD